MKSVYIMPRWKTYVTQTQKYKIHNQAHLQYVFDMCGKSSNKENSEPFKLMRKKKLGLVQRCYDGKFQESFFEYQNPGCSRLDWKNNFLSGDYWATIQRKFSQNYDAVMMGKSSAVQTKVKKLVIVHWSKRSPGGNLKWSCTSGLLSYSPKFHRAPCSLQVSI